MPEITIQVNAEDFEEVQRVAAAQHVDPEGYLSQVLASNLARTRFQQGAAAFIAEHAAGFADHFGIPAESRSAA
ncbi:hypothetical protein [Streptacidiphilus sp. EB103A]|uniref:hypothetical protein n=1 Tax=Streptacidiphilus sp. EB103A TaxID=3156275 RepID=UPI0035148825